MVVTWIRWEVPLLQSSNASGGAFYLGFAPQASNWHRFAIQSQSNRNRIWIQSHLDLIAFVRYSLSVGALTAEQWHLLATDAIRGMRRTRC